MESGKDISHSPVARVANAVPAPLTEYQLRMAAKHAGYTMMTHEQIRRLDEWGLLGRKVNGGWPSKAKERLLQARALELDGARFLPRRVLRLRAQGLERFPIPTEALRRAMVEMVDVIKRPARSLAIAHRAMCWLVEWQYAQYGPPRLGSRGHQHFVNEQRYPPAFPEAPLPAPSKWKAILQDSTVPNELYNGFSFASVASDQYRWDSLIQTVAAQHKIKTPYLEILPEERIVLLTVRHLGLAKQTTNQQSTSRDEQMAQLLSRLAQLNQIGDSPTLAVESLTMAAETDQLEAHQASEAERWVRTPGGQAWVPEDDARRAGWLPREDAPSPA